MQPELINRKLAQLEGIDLSRYKFGYRIELQEMYHHLDSTSSKSISNYCKDFNAILRLMKILKVSHFRSYFETPELSQINFTIWIKDKSYRALGDSTCEAAAKAIYKILES